MMGMVSKFLGICLIIGSSTAIGFWLSNRLKERIDELEIIKKLFMLLRGEIKYNHAALSEAFQTIARRMDNLYGRLLSKVSEQMDSMEGQTFTQIWTQCAEEGLKESALNKEDREKLISMGGQLGYLDIEMQLGTIELYLEQLQDEIQNARECLKRNGKLYQTMGVIAGIFVVILMV